MSKQTKKPEFEPGKIYLLKADVWAIDCSSEEYIQVYIREEVFKVKYENLVLMEGKSDE